jgi:cell division protein FtsN
MKGKILTLIIGILIGAIITTAGFLIYNKTVASSQPEMMQMDENGQMGKPDGENGEAPEKPDGDNGEEPPSKPDGDNGEAPSEKTDNSNSNTSNS